MQNNLSGQTKVKEHTIFRVQVLNTKDKEPKIDLIITESTFK